MDSESVAILIAGFFMGGFFGVCLTVLWLKTKSGFASLSLPFKQKDKKQNNTLFSKVISCRRCGSSDILITRTKEKGFLYYCKYCGFLDRSFVDPTTGKPANFPERSFK